MRATWLFDELHNFQEPKREWLDQNALEDLHIALTFIAFSFSWLLYCSYASKFLILEKNAILAVFQKTYWQSIKFSIISFILLIGVGDFTLEVTKAFSESIVISQSPQPYVAMYSKLAHAAFPKDMTLTFNTKAKTWTCSHPLPVKIPLATALPKGQRFKTKYLFVFDPTFEGPEYPKRSTADSLVVLGKKAVYFTSWVGNTPMLLGVPLFELELPKVVKVHRVIDAVLDLFEWALTSHFYVLIAAASSIIYSLRLLAFLWFYEIIPFSLAFVTFSNMFLHHRITYSQSSQLTPHTFFVIFIMQAVTMYTDISVHYSWMLDLVVVFTFNAAALSVAYGPFQNAQLQP